MLILLLLVDYCLSSYLSQIYMMLLQQQLSLCFGLQISMSCLIVLLIQLTIIVSLSILFQRKLRWVLYFRVLNVALGSKHIYLILLFCPMNELSLLLWLLLESICLLLETKSTIVSHIPLLDMQGIGPSFLLLSTLYQNVKALWLSQAIKYFFRILLFVIA